MVLELTGGSQSVEVLVAPTAPQRRFQDVGALTRAFSGLPHDSRRSRWTTFIGIRTAPLSPYDFDALDDVLAAAQPLTASGDLVGGSGIECYATSPEVIEWVPVGVERYAVMQFDLWLAQADS